MVILIAESKTMLSSEKEFSRNDLDASAPYFEKVASEIMDSLRGLTVGEIGMQLKLSRTLATKMQKMIYEFPYKSTGNRAIEAFTGVVFKSLDFATLSKEAQSMCENHVRIISTLYGWLRPQDIIKLYRMDFGTKLEEGPSDGKALNAFWRMDVTKSLVKLLNSSNEREVVDLLPADASKCVDWKLVKRFADVWKVDFKEMQEGGIMKTPTAERLKALRGTLLRQILTEGLSKASELLHVSSEQYVCEGTPLYPNHYRFLC